MAQLRAIEANKDVKKEEKKIADRNLVKDEKGDAIYEIKIPLYKIDDEKRLVGGVVYEPDVVDLQGDSATAEEIEKACHLFLIESETIGLMHKEAAGRRVRIVENYIMPVTAQVGDQIITKGSWVIVVKIFDDEIWKEVKEGKYTGFSMGGYAKVEE